MPDATLDIAIAVTLWASVGGLAMAHPPAVLLAPFRRWALLARVAALDLLVIPLAAWAVTQLLQVPTSFATGIILVAVTAAGPLGVVAVQLARADTALALVLVAFLEVANAAAVPLWTSLLFPAAAQVPLGAVMAVLVLYVIGPVVAGTLIRLLAPGVAVRLVGPARFVGFAGLAFTAAFVVITNVNLIGPAAGAGVPAATALTIALAFAGGWLIAGGERATRSAVALVSAQRGASLALAIAIVAFRGQPEAAVAVVLYGMISIVVVPLLGLALRERDQLGLAPARGHRDGQPTSTL